MTSPVSRLAESERAERPPSLSLVNTDELARFNLYTASTLVAACWSIEQVHAHPAASYEHLLHIALIAPAAAAIVLRCVRAPHPQRRYPDPSHQLTQRRLRGPLLRSYTEDRFLTVCFALACISTATALASGTPWRTLLAFMNALACVLVLLRGIGDRSGLNTPIWVPTRRDRISSVLALIVLVLALRFTVGRDPVLWLSLLAMQAVHATYAVPNLVARLGPKTPEAQRAAYERTRKSAWYRQLYTIQLAAKEARRQATARASRARCLLGHRSSTRRRHRSPGA